MLWIVIAIVFISIAFFVWIAIDLIKSLRIRKIPITPDSPIEPECEKLIAMLRNGTDISMSELEKRLDSTFEYINARYDCADFRLLSLIRLYLQFDSRLSSRIKDRINDTLLSFRYWMDQPGRDSMCYWSENHQILFAVCEYLAGQSLPGEIFICDKKTGLEHMDMAGRRINSWMSLRFQYGFSEWYSNVYYVEDLAAMSNFVDFSNNTQMVLQMRMIMDLLWFDIAAHSINGAFVATSGRMYNRHKMSSDTGNSLKDAIYSVLNNSSAENPITNTGMLVNFLLNKKYQVPEAIRNVMKDQKTQIILASNGLDLLELETEGLLGQKECQIMQHMGMEAYTNPVTIAHTIEYLNKNKLFCNWFLHDLRYLNISILRHLHLLPAISGTLRFPADGMALQRANVYTYRTGDYMLSTAQHYHPGMYGFQQHIFSATLAKDLSVFVTYPASEDCSGSPSFFIGNARHPDAYQYKGVTLLIFKLAVKKHFMEKNKLNYTHAYFPTEFMDEYEIDGRYAFCKKGNTFLALAGTNKLKLMPMRIEKGNNFSLTKPYEIVQEGLWQGWVCELSSADEDISFDAFKMRIKTNQMLFCDNGKLSYHTGGDQIELTYGNYASVNNERINTEYKRFECSYSNTERKPGKIEISCGDAALTLDFFNGIRDEASPC